MPSVVTQTDNPMRNKFTRQRDYVAVNGKAQSREIVNHDSEIEILSHHFSDRTAIRMKTKHHCLLKAAARKSVLTLKMISSNFTMEEVHHEHSIPRN